MAIITMPDDLEFSRFRPSYRRYDYDEVSDNNGAVATLTLGNPRWGLSVESPVRASWTQARKWIRLLLALNGKENHIAAWDKVRPVPAGTLRGTLTLLNAVSQGDITCTVTGGAPQAGNTLEPIDALQIGTGLGSQLIVVANESTVTANGSGQITFEFRFPARVDYAAGTAVTWDKPVAHYKMISDESGWDYDPGSLTVSSIGVDFLEQWQ